MLVLGKDQVLYSWIWKEDTKLKKYRKLDLAGISKLSLRGSEAFLIKKIPIPQLTQIVNYPNKAASTIPFSIILTLHDQFNPSFIPDALISLSFTTEKNLSNNRLEYELNFSDDDNNTVVFVTPFGFGDYWMHIFVEKQEILSSPVWISIVPSPDEESLIKKFDMVREIENMIIQKKTERKRRREEEKAKAVEDRAKKMERTRKRAQEALKNYLEKKESDIIRNEEDKQAKNKIKTGNKVLHYTIN